MYSGHDGSHPAGAENTLHPVLSRNDETAVIATSCHDYHANGEITRIMGPSESSVGEVPPVTGDQNS